MKRKFAILLTLVAVGLTSIADSAPRARPRERDGAYTVTIAGDYVGHGQSSTVVGDKVRLNANVTGRGSSGLLNATLLLNGTHFTGAGLVIGNTADFKGRLDAPDDDRERAIKGVRLVASFVVTNRDTGEKSYGSLVGYLPAQSTTAIDDDPDRRPPRR